VKAAPIWARSAGSFDGLEMYQRHRAATVKTFPAATVTAKLRLNPHEKAFPPGNFVLVAHAFPR
jgi:hypothetical protein